jgi:hypothetical protein
MSVDVPGFLDSKRRRRARGGGAFATFDNPVSPSFRQAGITCPLQLKQLRISLFSDLPVIPRPPAVGFLVPEPGEIPTRLYSTPHTGQTCDHILRKITNRISPAVISRSSKFIDNHAFSSDKYRLGRLGHQGLAVSLPLNSHFQFRSYLNLLHLYFQNGGKNILANPLSAYEPVLLAWMHGS